MRKKGLTLLEIVIATLILSLVMTGVANLFITAKRYLIHSRSRMAGGELGKLFLEPLQSGVRQDTWSEPDNPLDQGTKYCDDNPAHPQHPNCPSATSRLIDNITYTTKYKIDRGNPLTHLTKVKLEVNWNEPSP
jgi:prepilin-type N-terminal cleavage/methylation domain-containing protein